MIGVIVIVAIVTPVVVVTGRNNSQGQGTSSESSAAQPAITSNSKTGAALLMVNVQDCFLEPSVTSTGEPGSLEVADTGSLIPTINEAREQKDCLFHLTVRTNDVHPKSHISFADTHGLPPFAHARLGKGGLPITCTNSLQSASCCPTYWVDGKDSQDCDKVLCPVEANMTQQNIDHVLASPACSYCKENGDNCFTTKQAMWPDHCIQGQESGVPPSLITSAKDIILPKGDNDYVDSYSAFFDNTRNIKTPLDAILKSHNIDTVYLMGIATDYGVKSSAVHAVFLGYKVVVILDASRHIAEDTYEAALKEMRNIGATIIDTQDLLEMECTTSSN